MTARFFPSAPQHLGAVSMCLLHLRVTSVAIGLWMLASTPDLTAAQESPALASVGPETLRRMSVEELLETKVVSAARRPEELGRTPSSIYRIGANTVRVTGATNLPQLMRLTPQLFTAQSSSREWAINARGFVRSNSYSNKLLVMIDGRSVYSPFFSNVFWDSQDIFLPDLDRIEVISGPAGSNWGSNAVNGVINILTKSAFETQGGHAYAGIGTNGENHLGLRQGGRFGNNGAWRVYAKRMEFGETRAPANGDPDDSWDFIQGGFRSDWQVDQRSSFTLQGDFYDGSFKSGIAPRAETNGANILGRWNRRLFNGGELWVRAYHDYVFRDNHGTYRQETVTSDLEFQHSVVLSERQEFLWGANYRGIRDRVRGLGDSGFIDILPNRLDYELISLFGQHSWHLADRRFGVVSGLRLEHNHFSGWEALPNVRLFWRPRGFHTFWAGASRATRIPDRLDRGFHMPPTPPYFIAGGAGFDSEVVHAYEVGWRARPTRALAFTATLYVHDYDDLRSVEAGEFSFNPNGTVREVIRPVTIDNGVKGRSRGAEVFVDWDVTDWWRFRAGGFYNEQETSVAEWSNDLGGGLEEISFPEYQVQFRSTFRPVDHVTLWFALRRVDEVPGFEEGQTGLVPAYTELDASINWEVRPGLELSLTGRNLLDSSHSEIGLDAQRREIRRSATFMVRWSY